MKKRISLPIAVLAVFLAVGITFSATYFPMRYLQNRTVEHYESNYLPIPDGFDLPLLNTVIDWVSRDSIRAFPDYDALTGALIEAVLGATGDRYAAYFDDAEYAEYKLGLSGGFVGVGVTVAKDENGNAEILLIHPGAPIEGYAEVGDRIVAVNGVTTAEAGYETVLTAIAGEAGSDVTLSVLHEGITTNVTLKRAAITKQTVISRMISKEGRQIGYVLLTGFDGHTFEQFRAAVSALEEQGAEAFVFDVRSNGGGLLTEISKVLAYLLPDGVIAYVDYASEEFRDYVISSSGERVTTGSGSTVYAEGGHSVGVPMAVLVNGKTASAAELFASALRDYATGEYGERIDATLIGETTYGKGTVQTTFALTATTAMKFSVAYYNPPCNITYDGIGITPDLPVSLPEDAAGKSILALRGEEDTQLAAALEVLLNKLNQP